MQQAGGVSYGSWESQKINATTPIDLTAFFQSIGLDPFGGLGRYFSEKISAHFQSSKSELIEYSDTWELDKKKTPQVILYVKCSTTWRYLDILKFDAYAYYLKIDYFCMKCNVESPLIKYFQEKKCSTFRRRAMVHNLMNLPIDLRKQLDALGSTYVFERLPDLESEEDIRQAIQEVRPHRR